MAQQRKGRNGGTLNVLQKGETANPNGRPKSAKYLTQLLKKEMGEEAEIIIEGVAQHDARTGQPVKVRVKMPTERNIIQALLRKAAKGDTRAIEMIFDRTEGKVAQTLVGDPDHPLIPPAAGGSLTQKQIDKLIEKL